MGYVVQVAMLTLVAFMSPYPTSYSDIIIECGLFIVVLKGASTKSSWERVSVYIHFLVLCTKVILDRVTINQNPFDSE